jgi:hypothetical protein
MTQQLINVLRVKLTNIHKVVTTHDVSFVLRMHNALEITSFCKSKVVTGVPINPVLPSFNAFTQTNNVWEERSVQLDTQVFYARNVITIMVMLVAVNNLLVISARAVNFFIFLPL